MPELRDAIHTAHVVLPCENLGEMLSFLIDRLGFRLDMIFPADDPRAAVVSGYGLSLRLETTSTIEPVRLRLQGEFPGLLLEGPSGLRVQLIDSRVPIERPVRVPQGLIVNRSAPDWIEGRAGMLYRDLIPGRLGGRLIASQIRIPQGGDVPDYVHYHRVDFQMIYCRKGWVRVVYEDQGPPFVLRAGDCVLQPPEIRHRVLESSAGLEVIEIASPALHETCADHAMSLPTAEIRPDRDFYGQRFVRHIAGEATWEPWMFDGFEARDIGIGAATNGLAAAHVVRQAASQARPIHSDELFFLFVLQGALTIDETQILIENECCVLPAGREFLLQADHVVEMLVVSKTEGDA
jgi:quercetin dioxygenase-like cupin family protein